jgi:hypothetical protein
MHYPDYAIAKKLAPLLQRCTAVTTAGFNFYVVQDNSANCGLHVDKIQFST